MCLFDFRTPAHAHWEGDIAVSPSFNIDTLLINS